MFVHSLFTLSLAVVGYSTPTWATPVLNARGYNNDACATAAAAAADWFTQNPKADPKVDFAFIDAEIAYNCLTSVPLHTDPAIQLVNSLKGYFQVQSTVDYLRTPPAGYLFDTVDLPRSLDTILQNIKDSKYNSEYDLQVDLKSLISSAHDGHFNAAWDLSSVFSFQRDSNDIILISVSKDGKELPQVYLSKDVFVVAENEFDIALSNGIASPVTKINELAVDQFLQLQASVTNSQDPDAQYNAVVYSLALNSAPADSLTTFNAPHFYPGPETILEFQNGTKYTSKNLAKVTGDLTGITNGESMYQKFCIPPPPSTATATATATATESELPPTPTATQVPEETRFPGYPFPEIKDKTGAISGYFLDKEVAVLTIRTFEKETEDFLIDFQKVVEDFLAACKKSGMKKLILDLMGNPGGYIDLGTDLLAQLFPKSTPDTKSDIRASTGMYLLMQAGSNLVDQAETVDPTTNADETEVTVKAGAFPFAWQSAITDEARNFNNLHDYYGPYLRGQGMFTSFFQANYTNDLPSQWSTGTIDITGYGNRTGQRDQIFDAKDIIVLTDAYCASTCTVVSESLKNEHGVQFIVIGGRPQTGPMQAIGGVKGSQIFETSIFQKLVEWWENPDLVDINQAKGSPWEFFDGVPLARGFNGANGRNHYRFGDKSTTPLQFVYEAADCRIWNTAEMITNITLLWDRVSTLAFQNRKGGVITSDYCIKDSTKHATSISGGLKKGDLGPQTPPANAKPKYKGYLLNGNKVVDTLVNSGPSAGPANTKPGPTSKALGSIKDACHSYTGSRWFVQAVCGALG